MRALLALAIVALAAGLVAADAAWRHARASAGGPYDWSATEALLVDAGLRSVRVSSSLLAVEDVGGVIVPASGVAPLPAELDRLESFVRGGGRLLVLGEPAVAARFGMEVSRAPILPTEGGAVRSAGGTLLADVTPLLGSGEPTLVTTAETFVDADGDGRAGANDVAGPFVVGRTAAEGRVLVLSLRETPTDGMIGRFFEPGALVALDGSRALHDAPLVDAFLAASLDVAERPHWTGALGTLLVLAAWASWKGLRAQQREMPRDGGRTPLPEDAP